MHGGYGACAGKGKGPSIIPAGSALVREQSAYLTEFRCLAPYADPPRQSESKTMADLMNPYQTSPNASLGKLTGAKQPLRLKPVWAIDQTSNRGTGPRAGYVQFGH
jgi:hypothetical protein